MDIVNIITKLRDLEKLKILLLNEDQLLLFNYLSKPLISIGKKNPEYAQEMDTLSRREYAFHQIDFFVVKNGGAPVTQVF